MICSTFRFIVSTVDRKAVADAGVLSAVSSVVVTDVARAVGTTIATLMRTLADCKRMSTSCFGTDAAEAKVLAI